MSKLISAPMLAHLSGPLTTMTTCWRLVRIDGATFGFTNLDIDLTVDGQLYQSASGFSRTAIINHSTGEIDNLDVVGYFSEDGIIERDIRNGKFDYATIYLFAVNWMDLSMGICRLRRGFLGECIRAPDGAFSAELRGLAQALVQEFGNVYSPLCRADLGDHQCKIPIWPDPWVANTLYSAEFMVRPFALGVVDAAYTAAFRASAEGTSGSSEPAWNYTIGATTADGSVTWTAIASFRGLGEVVATINQRSFRSSHLLYPGNQVANTGSITFINNITAGTSIEISDGILTYSKTIPFDTLGSTVRSLILGDFAASITGLNMSADGSNPHAINLTNHTGKQGVITKFGDLVPGMIIGQFASNYLDGGTITWVTGLNAGISMELKTYDTDQTRVILWLGMKYAIQAGDKFIYYPGCDKRRDTCHIKFNNILNMRAEPDIQGVNRMMAYPDAA